MRKFIKDRACGWLDNFLYDWGWRLINFSWPFLASFLYWALARLGTIEWRWWVNAILLAIAIILAVFGIFRTRPKRDVGVSPRKNIQSAAPDNTDQKVAQWIEARFPERTVLVNDKLHFGFAVKAPQSGLDVLIRRFKKQPTRITLSNRINTTDTQRSAYKKMPFQAKESLLRTIRIESSRWKIDPHWGNGLEFVCLHNDVLITPELTEARLMDGINDVKFAHSVIHHAINNLLGEDVSRRLSKTPQPVIVASHSSEFAEAIDELNDTLKQVSGLVTRYQLTGVSLPDINDVNAVRQRMRAAIRRKGLDGLVKANEFNELLQPASALEGDEEEEFLEVKTNFLDRGFLEGKTDTENAIFDDLLNKQVRLKKQIERIESRSLS